MTAFDRAWLIVKQDVMRLEDYPLTGLEGGLPPSNLRGEELFVTAGKKPGSKSSLPYHLLKKCRRLHLEYLLNIVNRDI